MNKTNPFNAVRAFITIAVMILSACAPAAPAQVGGSTKVEAAPVEFTGAIQAINGDQWTVNDQTVTVAPAAVAGASFQVGDSVHVSGLVGADGRIVASTVGLPATAAKGLSAASADTATPDPSATTEPTATAEPTGSGEATGVVDSISSTEIVVGGTTYAIDSSTEIKDNIAVGDTVKVHYVTNSDGTFTATEIELADGSGGTGGACDDENSNEDDDTNSNEVDDCDDENSNDVDDENSNDDDDENSNDDDDENSNDDDDSGNGNGG